MDTKENIKSYLGIFAFLMIIVVVGLLWGDFGVNAMFVAIIAYIIGGFIGYRRGYKNGVNDTESKS